MRLTFRVATVKPQDEIAGKIAQQILLWASERYPKAEIHVQSIPLYNTFFQLDVAEVFSAEEHNRVAHDIIKELRTQWALFAEKTNHELDSN